MMCSQLQLNDILGQVRQKALALFGDALDAVILYGSYARGDYDEESDIDLMVRVKLPKEALAAYRKEFSRLSSDLGLTHDIFISIHLQDYKTFTAYKDHVAFYRNVEQEGVMVSA